MTRRTIIAAVAALAALAVPSAASAQDGYGYTAFETPSRNIACVTDGDAIACDVRNRGITVAMDAYSYPDQFWSNDDIYGDWILRYGRRTTEYPFACTSQRSGLTCRSLESGHGFFLSRQRIRTW